MKKTVAERSQDRFLESSPERRSPELAGIFLSPEESLAWRHAYGEGKSEKDIINEVLTRKQKEPEYVRLKGKTEEPTEEDLGYKARELYRKSKELHYQFLWHGRPELKTELMELLDELLRCGFISRDDYNIGANSLSGGH